MKYNGVIQRKFTLLDKHLLELQKHLKDINFSTFKNDWALRCMAERSLQVMVEIVIDIAERIIAIEDAGPTATSAEALEKLEKLGVIKSALSYGNMIKFRNFIVHQYEEIDPEIVFNIAKNQLDKFRMFRDEIDKIE
ncbi:MAG: DUF86 domain-containing protein [Phycisphaerae bacterium]|jgi:uncharacterized protein YutE (UPF0331/DUF86 family)|nr:MAG: hypothetical protein A2Y13_08280 [Planctomycetes bacterium GWC2_45_44]HBG77295.1 hypothetical protein [Phycisphaerales bacterium]HBR19173.1 hypothetical protein [Phycisphaerales bacterium]